MLRERIAPPLRSWFLAHGQGLVAAYLFGSVARGQDRRDSDVDLAVVLGRRKGPQLEDLDRLALMQQQLGDLLQRAVDLVPLDGASPDLRHHVLADHVLLLDGDHDARVEFEIRTRQDYADHLPFLLAYRQAVLRRA
ncbi:MAG: nucleotidyltransferase domain-containing protein [Planctomycetes bacterium]|nr:nucleotidyltransferase domain-containing protein [Planctomycetota bacterium]